MEKSHDFSDWAMCPVVYCVIFFYRGENGDFVLHQLGVKYPHCPYLIIDFHKVSVASVEIAQLGRLRKKKI